MVSLEHLMVSSIDLTSYSCVEVGGFCCLLFFYKTQGVTPTLYIPRHTSDIFRSKCLAEFDTYAEEKIISKSDNSGLKLTKSHQSIQIRDIALA